MDCQFTCLHGSCNGGPNAGMTGFAGEINLLVYRLLIDFSGIIFFIYSREGIESVIVFFVGPVHEVIVFENISQILFKIGLQFG